MEAPNDNNIPVSTLPVDNTAYRPGTYFDRLDEKLRKLNAELKENEIRYNERLEQQKIKDFHFEQMKLAVRLKLDNFIASHTDAQSALCDFLDKKTDSKFWLVNHLAIDDIADELNIYRPDLPSDIKVITVDEVKRRLILYLRGTSFELLKELLLECMSGGDLDHTILP